MIVAEIYTQGDGKIIGFVIRGHSRGGGHGYNIHCAEVSMLSQTAYLAIGRYLERKIAASNHEHGGLGIELGDAPDDLTEAVFRIMLIGLRDVETVAPNDIQIKLIEMDSSTEENLQTAVKNMKPTPKRALPEVDVEDVKIRADIYRGDDGKIVGFSVAERDEEIIDKLKIYCASTRILVKATFDCVKDYLKRDADFIVDGRKISLNLKTAPDDVTEAVFQTMLIGLTELEKIAPQIINVKENFPRR